MEKAGHILLTGGVVGGAAFAARAKRIQTDAAVTLFEQGGFISCVF